MKFKEEYNINPEFASMFEFKSEKDELQHDAKILMFRFLSEIERLSEDGILQKKDFANALNVSKSFITQLFNGDKLANLITLAKLQKVFNVRFEIKAYHKDYSSINLDVISNKFFHSVSESFGTDSLNPKNGGSLIDVNSQPIRQLEWQV